MFIQVKMSVRNPVTLRMIKIGGPTYKKLQKQGYFSLETVKGLQELVFSIPELCMSILQYLSLGDLKQMLVVNKDCNNITKEVLVRRIVGEVNISTLDFMKRDGLIFLLLEQKQWDHIKFLISPLPQFDRDSWYHSFTRTLLWKREELNYSNTEFNSLLLRLLSNVDVNSLGYYITSEELLVLFVEHGFHLIKAISIALKNNYNCLDDLLKKAHYLLGDVTRDNVAEFIKHNFPFYAR